MENKEKQNSVYTITRSYSENFQHELAGGHRFEKSDFFSSHSQSFFIKPTVQEITETAEILYYRAKDNVEKAIKQKKAEIRINNSQKTKEDIALTADLEIQAEDDEAKKILLKENPDLVSREIKEAKKE